MNLRTPLGLLVALLLLGCSVDAAEPSPYVPAKEESPTLDLAGAERIAFAADDAHRLAYARLDPEPLRELFSATLQESEARRLAGLARTGASLEETVIQRRVVHLGTTAGRAEIVLAVTGRQRRSVPGAASRPASAFVRQWSLAVVWTGGHWLIESAQDLPPDRWWS